MMGHDGSSCINIQQNLNSVDDVNEGVCGVDNNLGSDLHPAHPAVGHPRLSARTGQRISSPSPSLSNSANITVRMTRKTTTTSTQDIVTSSVTDVNVTASDVMLRDNNAKTSSNISMTSVVQDLPVMCHDVGTSLCRDVTSRASSYDEVRPQVAVVHPLRHEQQQQQQQQSLQELGVDSVVRGQVLRTTWTSQVGGSAVNRQMCTVRPLQQQQQRFGVNSSAVTRSTTAALAQSSMAMLAQSSTAALAQSSTAALAQSSTAAQMQSHRGATTSSLPTANNPATIATTRTTIAAETTSSSTVSFFSSTSAVLGAENNAAAAVASSSLVSESNLNQELASPTLQRDQAARDSQTLLGSTVTLQGHGHVTGARPERHNQPGQLDLVVVPLEKDFSDSSDSELSPTRSTAEVPKVNTSSSPIGRDTDQCGAAAMSPDTFDWPVGGVVRHLSELSVGEERESSKEGERRKLEKRCPFYFGGMSNSEAKTKLKHYEVGSYLLRDSSDPKYLYSLSVKTPRGTTSIRIAETSSCDSCENCRAAAAAAASSCDTDITMTSYINSKVFNTRASSPGVGGERVERGEGCLGTREGGLWQGRMVRLDCEPAQEKKMPHFTDVLSLIDYCVQLGRDEFTRHRCVFLEKSGRMDTPILLKKPVNRT